MKRKALIVFFATLSSSLLGGPSVAVAGEKVLEFTLVTKAIDVRPIDVVNVENQTVGQGRYFGVAAFKDGRIAIKDFVFDLTSTKAGPFYGTAPTLDDGRPYGTLTGETKPNQVQHGEYRIFWDWRLRELPGLAPSTAYNPSSRASVSSTASWSS
jgi:hypothetical protein